MDNLEHLLSEQKGEYRFSAGFTDRVMASVQDEGRQQTRVVSMWQKRILRASVACVAALLISVYALDGSLSIDALLGLSEHSALEIGQSMETYNQWDIN